MSYTAKTWVTGEVIQAVDLNHAEQGIATAQSGVDAISANGAIDTANLANGAVTLAKLADAVKSHFALADDVDEVKSAVNDINTVISDGYMEYTSVVNGSFTAGGLTTGNAKRIRTALIPVSSGGKVIIDGNGLQHACGAWRDSVSASNIVRNDDVFSSAIEAYEPSYDGFMVVVFRYSNNSDIAPTAFNGSVKVYPATMKNIDSVTDAVIVTKENNTWIQGGFAGGAKPAFTTSNIRCRTPLIHVYPLDKVAIVLNGQQYAISMWTLTSGVWAQIRNDSTWKTEDITISIDRELYMVVAIRKADNSTIYPDEVVASVTVTGIQSMNYVNSKIERAETTEKQILLGFEPLTESGHTVSHRGMPYPENTYYAFEKCISDGSKILEMDLAFTSDNVAVLLHDKTINRTARNADGSVISETISIKDITYEQALTYDFGIYLGTQYTGLKIPRLIDVLLLLKQKRCAGIIDLLGHEYTDAQLQILHDILIGTKMVSKCCLNGAATTLQRYGEWYNDTPFNPTSSTNNIRTLKNTVNLLNPMTPLIVASGYVENAEDLTYTFFSEANALGVVTLLGMVNAVEGIKELFNAGCDLVYSETIRDPQLDE